jgi:ATP-dependent helicase/nuclease subunit B
VSWKTLGFKIDEKLAGYDEEALLLMLLKQAATERLVLSYQRADEQGRVLTASPFVAQTAAACGLDERSIESVPRRLTDRVAQKPALLALLPPDDVSLWMTLAGRDAAGLLDAVGRDAACFRRGREALDRLEDDRSRLAACDGFTGELPDHWNRLVERGLAPTPLERYAHCPFQYFAADVLRLQPVRQPPAPELDPALIGTVCHAALRRCYEQLIPMGWPAKPVTDDTVEWCVYNAVAQAAEEHEARHRTGYYLLWELAKEVIVEVMSAAVEADEAAQAEDHFIPAAFEVEAEGTLPPLADGEPPLKIRGRVDRVDCRSDGDGLRIVDYKFKIGSSGKPEDRRLVQAAVRGARLQPPLYACLEIPPGHRRPDHVQLLFLAPRWPTPIVRSTFESAVWSSEQGGRLRETLRMLLDGIRAGRFFILPDGYCDRCEFRVSCRRDHTPTWWRAYRAAEPKQLRALRALTVRDE